MSYLDVEERAVAVLHQGIAAEGEFRLFPRALSRQAGLGVGGTFMDAVRADLIMKVHRRIVRIVRRALITAALALEALQGRPGPDQGAVDTEVFVGQQALAPGRGGRRR